MKTVVCSAVALTVLFTGSTVAWASADSDDGAVLVPHVTSGQVLQYDETDRLSGAIKHSHHQVVTFRVIDVSPGALTFERTASGKAASTVTVDFARVAEDQNAANFFFPRGFLDGAPTALTVGSSWQARLREESSLGSPGTARFEVVSVDRAAGRVTIRGALKGQGDSTDTTPGDTSPTKFHTATDRTVTVVLTNGVIDTYTVVGDDKQSANGSDPISVHVEMAYRRVK